MAAEWTANGGCSLMKASPSGTQRQRASPKPPEFSRAERQGKSAAALLASRRAHECSRLGFIALGTTHPGTALGAPTLEKAWAISCTSGISHRCTELRAG